MNRMADTQGEAGTVSGSSSAGFSGVPLAMVGFWILVEMKYVKHDTTKSQVWKTFQSSWDQGSRVWCLDFAFKLLGKCETQTVPKKTYKHIKHICMTFKRQSIWSIFFRELPYDTTTIQYQIDDCCYLLIWFDWNSIESEFTKAELMTIMEKLYRRCAYMGYVQHNKISLDPVSLSKVHLQHLH